METERTALWILGPAWGSAFAYAMSILLWRNKIDGWSRVCWIAGWGLLLVHVLAAYHFRHHWSHAAAAREVGRRTGELFGAEIGWGIWFNDLVLAVWGWDVVRWCGLGAERYRVEMGPWTRLGRVYVGFMMFNAVVVFGKTMGSVLYF